MKDIADLLEEVHTIVQALRGDKMLLEDRLKTLEDQLSTVEKAKKSMMGDLQETKEKLGRELQATKAKLDQVHPEMQSLQHELQNAEVQNNLLAMDLKRKDEEIKTLELRLREYTALTSSSFQIEEPIR
jgi:peptidoglycan hydrolase CwlO-like protein